MASDIRQVTHDAWQPEAERLFQNANMQIDRNEMSDLYSSINGIFGVYFDMGSRADYDAPLRAWGCAREVARMDSKRRIAAWAYIIALKKDRDRSTQLMGQEIEEALQQFFLTGVLPPSREEFLRDYSKTE